MRLPGEDEPERFGGSVLLTIIILALFVTVVLFSVFKSNEKPKSRYLEQKAQIQAQNNAVTEQESALEEPVEVKRRAEDLDFWDMYPVEDSESQTADNDREEEPSKNALNGENTMNDSKPAKTSYAEKAEKDRQEIKQKEQEEIEKDPSKDGKHTLVKNRDGSEEWVLISPYLTKNTYDFTNLEEKAHIKRYLENGRNVSYVGVDISKDTGDIKFDSMKATGVDYVMVKAGARGYSTGQIVPDPKFEEYVQGALDADIQVGVYFISEAISVDEVVEETNFVLQKMAPFQQRIKYPVVFQMGFTPNAESRIDGVNRNDRTTFAVTFLEAVKAAGYVPMIYGNKEWLVKEIDLTKLTAFDVWLADESDMPDYPYRFSMWQYSTKGVLNGIEGDADLNISFINYAER